MATNITHKILLRGDTSSNWLTADPVLADREVVTETDSRRFKIGDGVTPYSSLPYASEATSNIQRFTFTPALEWVVNHNRGTTLFTERLTDDAGNRFNAKVHIVDENTFVVKLSTATAGHVDVLFNSV